MNATSKKKRLLLLAFLFLLALGAALWSFSLPGMQVGDDFWRKLDGDTYRLDNANTVTLAGDGTTTHFRLLYGGQAIEADMVVSGGILRCAYSDGDVVEGSIIGTQLIDADGFPLWMTDGVSISVDGVEVSTAGKGRLTQMLYRMRLGETDTREGMVMLLCLVLLYPLGAAHFLYPDKMALLFKRWYYASPELSDAGRRWERIGGVVMMAGGVILGFLPLLF